MNSDRFIELLGSVSFEMEERRGCDACRDYTFFLRQLWALCGDVIAKHEAAREVAEGDQDSTYWRNDRHCPSDDLLEFADVEHGAQALRFKPGNDPLLEDQAARLLAWHVLIELLLDYRRRELNPFDRAEGRWPRATAVLSVDDDGDKDDPEDEEAENAAA